MNRAEGLADFDPDQLSLARPEGSIQLHQVRERSAADEVAPKPDPAVKPVDSVHGNDIGMPDPRHGARFAQNCFCLSLRTRVPPEEQLDRDLALQGGIPCPVDFAAASLPYFFDEAERSPLLCRVGRASFSFEECGNVVLRVYRHAGERESL